MITDFGSVFGDLLLRQPSGPAEISTDFEANGYVLIRQFLDEPLLTVAYRYLLLKETAGDGRQGDGQVGAFSIYGDSLMECLLELAHPAIEQITARKLWPTYSYCRLYQCGDVLKPHRDRRECEISVTLCLGHDVREIRETRPGYLWPIYMDAKPVRIEPGDMVIYKGGEVEHWREAFEGKNQAQVFLHYVDQTGPDASASRFDGRPGVGFPECTRIAPETLRNTSRRSAHAQAGTEVAPTPRPSQSVKSCIHKYFALDQIPYVKLLVDFVRSHWKRAGYEESNLAEIASNALTMHPPCELEISQVLSWALSTPLLPTQPDVEGTFGNPPLCLHLDEQFQIDLYLWRESTTSIHDHKFNGAFCVLEGSSFHISYDFEVEDEVSPSFRLGHLNILNAEQLRRGDVRSIVSGPELIHTVFHLVHPSATLCIRSRVDPSIAMQYGYHPPGIATQAFYEASHPGFRRRRQVAEAAFALNDSVAIDATVEFMRQCAWLEAFQLIQNVARRQCDISAVQPLLEVLHERHHKRASRIEDAVRQDVRNMKVLRMREFARDEHQRFLVGLLGHLENRRSILQQVQQRYPGEDAADRISELYVSLSQTLAEERRELVPKLQPLVGLAIRHMLKDTPDEQVPALVAQEARQRGLPGNEAAATMAVSRARRLASLKPLFATSE